MQRVRGIGGIFFKARTPGRLRAGTPSTSASRSTTAGAARFLPWREHDPGGDAYTVWTPFKAETDYFAPTTATFMVNFRVDDLDAMLAQPRRWRTGRRQGRGQRLRTLRLVLRSRGQQDRAVAAAEA